MTDGVDQRSAPFELKGHDCPLGQYPSVAVPVGMVNGNLVAVHTAGNTPEFYSVKADAKFQEHNSTTTGTLQGFDPFMHGLFALSATEVVMYNIGEEKMFYSRLLRYSPAFYIEPFYRLSLAIETDETPLIRRSFFSCAKHIMRDAPQAMKVWITAVSSLHPSVAFALAEWQRTLDKPAHQPAKAAVSAAHDVAALPRPDMSTVPVPVSKDMNSVSINQALDQLGLSDNEIKLAPRGAYSTAIRISLGLPNLNSIGRQEAPPLFTDALVPPTAADVGQVSGLSLPLLELRNIILSRSTAVEFLKLSRSGLRSTYLLEKIFRPEVYRSRLKRTETKIRRRQVFTYAEVLSLVGYAGPIEVPAWL